MSHRLISAIQSLAGVYSSIKSSTFRLLSSARSHLLGDAKPSHPVQVPLACQLHKLIQMHDCSLGRLFILRLRELEQPFSCRLSHLFPVRIQGFCRQNLRPKVEGLGRRQQKIHWVEVQFNRRICEHKRTSSSTSSVGKAVSLSLEMNPFSARTCNHVSLN